MDGENDAHAFLHPLPIAALGPTEEMAGILASLFSAIVFTRIIFDYMVIERRMSVSYG